MSHPDPRPSVDPLALTTPGAPRGCPRRRRPGTHSLRGGSQPGRGHTHRGRQPRGFWLGLWQGIIVPVTFVVSLFTDSVSIYEVHNNGNWYDFGFVLGLGLFVGGPFGASRGRRHG
ncbi:hypothetical protein NKG05_30425 [Oerskovia sp. M15]